MRSAAALLALSLIMLPACGPSASRIEPVSAPMIQAEADPAARGGALPEAPQGMLAVADPKAQFRGFVKTDEHGLIVFDNEILGSQASTVYDTSGTTVGYFFGGSKVFLAPNQAFDPEVHRCFALIEKDGTVAPECLTVFEAAGWDVEAGMLPAHPLPDQRARAGTPAG